MLPPGIRLLDLAPLARGRKGGYKRFFFDLRRQGYARVHINRFVRTGAYCVRLQTGVG